MAKVHVRMYGRVDIIVDGQRCLLPAGRAVELLVLLSAWPGTIVLDATLAGRLADIPSAAVDNEVHRMVTAVRRSVQEVDASLGDLWIRNVPGGYQVDSDLVSSDLTVAQELLDGDPNDTEVMWWSEPLLGMDLDPFLHVYARLDDLAMQLAERVLTEFTPTLGRIEFERLLELLARHPDQTDLWSRLVEAAIGSGDAGVAGDVRMELQVLQRDMDVPADWLDRLTAAAGG